MSSRRSSTRSTVRLMRIAARAFNLLCGAYFLWEAVTYSGFYAFLAEFQIAHFGGYVPLFNYALLFFIALIPTLIVAWLVRRMRKKHNRLANPLRVALNRARYIRKILFWSAGIAGAFALGAAIYATFLLPSSSGRSQMITASGLDPAEVIEGQAVLVGGELGRVATFGQFWFLGQQYVAYAPYSVPESEGGETQLFVHLRASTQAEFANIEQRASWSGFLVKGELPGTMRALFAHLGVRISKPYFTLYASKGALQALYWVQVAQLALLAICFLILGYFQSRRIRRLESEIKVNPYKSGA